MADEPQVIRGIDWRSTFPFTLIFRSFRIAIHPSKLFLALVALFLIYVGGRALDGIWVWWPEHRALPTEMLIVERSRDADNPVEAFVQQRRMQREAIEARHKQTLEEVGHPTGGMKDIEFWIKDRLKSDVKDINTRYDGLAASAKNASEKADVERRRNGELRLRYEEASSRWRSELNYEGLGLFQTFFNYEIGQLNYVVNSVRTGNFFGNTGVSTPLVRFFMWGPLWAIGRHTVFFSLFGIYFLTIWSIFGGALARIAAVHVARDEKISIRQALAFSLNKFLSFISAPIIPLLIVLIVGLVVAIGGVLGNIPGLGPILIGGFFFLALLAGFIMSLILLGLVGGLNLMYPTIAVEGSDSFDAISRSFSYLYARPWRLAFYSFVAVIYGSICYIFVRFFIYLMLWLSHAFAGLWFQSRAENGTPLFSVMWPEPYSNNRLIYDIDYLVLTPMQSFGATLLAFWVYLTIAMLGAFAISFYFSSNTVIYYLMRNEVDATELDDVYLEQSDEEFTDTVTTTTVTTETTTVEPSAPAAEDVPPSATAPEEPPQ
ncbi:hypothetical protein BH09PLA1_BH09PLA1_30370 [soil metagenome]